MKYTIKHIHLVGIGGLGMSGIAEILFGLGYKVSGSDIKESFVTCRLRKIGINIFIGHSSNNISGADVVVTSAAIPSNNAEVSEAHIKNIMVVSRAAMLAELMRPKLGIAISGTHGKTTTTGLIANMLDSGNLNPTFIVGGILNSIGTNASLGRGDHIIVEADESDASFLSLSPTMLVITNIDRDHMGTYEWNLKFLKNTFLKFTERLPFYGKTILCLDDINTRELIPLISKPVITYGFDLSANVRAYEIQVLNTKMYFKVQRRNVHGFSLPTLQIVLNLPGLHNVRNALAAIAIATELRISDQVICDTLSKFGGVKRRFTNLGKITIDNDTKFTLIDDYGHHPTEIEVTLSAARSAWPGKRIVLVFQPHRYTRTRDCFRNFVQVLSSADCVLLTETYSAGESLLEFSDGATLYQELSRSATKIELGFSKNVEDMPNLIANFVRNDDIVIVMGAGSIGMIPEKLFERFSCGYQKR